MSVAQVFSFTLNFASSVIVARYLEPRQFGIFAIGMALVGLLSVIQQIGLPAFIVREESLTREVTTTAFTSNLLLALLLSVLIVGASFAGGTLFDHPGVRDILLVLAPTPLIGAVAFLPFAMLEREGRFKQIAVASLASTLLASTVTIALTLLHFSFMGLAYGQLVGGGTSAAILLALGREHVSFKLGIKEWRRVGRFSYQMLLVSGAGTAAQRISEVCLGAFLGLGNLGLFNRASGMNNLLWSNIHYVLSRVFLVEFSKLNRHGAPLDEKYIETVANVSALLWPAFAGLIVLSEPIVTLVYGEKWTAAVRPFMLLACASMVWVPSTMTWELFTSTGRVAALSRIEVMRSIISTAAFALGCLISLEAAAATRIFDAAIVYMFYRPHINAMTGTTFRDFRVVYLKGAALTVVAVLPAVALVSTVGSNRIDFLLLFCSVLSGVVLWGFALALVRHPLGEHLALIYRGMRRRISAY
jgi:O-antigen/teichoic acid export membrane protein